MKPQDKAPFIETLTGVYALYNQPISAAVIDIWWNAMLKFDLSSVKESLSRHAMNPDVGQFIPKPADVVRELAGARSDVAFLSWMRVMDAVRNTGNYVSVDFNDQIIHRVIQDLGGWQWLCAQTTDDLVFIERRFRDAYRAYANRGVLPDYPDHLVGYFEQENKRTGFAAPQVQSLEQKKRPLLE